MLGLPGVAFAFAFVLVLPTARPGIVQPAVLFQQARAAAAGLPPLLAEKELEMIASDELVALPTRSLRDFRVIYAVVHLWPTGSDTTVAKARTKLRYEIEAAAIEAFAKRGDFKQALQWAAAYDPGNQNRGYPDWVYSQIILQMLFHRDFAEVESAFEQCANEGDGFPYLAGATAIGATVLPEMQRLEMARAGLQSAGAQVQADHAARFLMAVHSTFPEMDSQVEDSILGLLQTMSSELKEHRAYAGAYSKAGAELSGLLNQIDATRAEATRARYPNLFAGYSGGVEEISGGGSVAGFALQPGIVRQLYFESSSAPDAALAGAAAIRDKSERFAALAEIADAVSAAHPAQAAGAAESAYALLDDDVAAAETGFVVNLAHAYLSLGDRGRAAEIAEAALAAADRHVEQSAAQFDVSTPEGAAKMVHDLPLAAGALTYEYNRVATFLPAAAVRHALACKSDIIKPLALAKVAEGMTAAGARVPF